MTTPTFAFTCLILCLGAGAGTAQIPASRPGSGRRPAPDFTLETLSGEQISLETFAGKPLVLSFVRPGQRHSRRALRALTKLSRKHGKHAAFLAVVSGPGLSDKAREMAREHAAGLQVAVDPQRKAYGAYHVIVAPTTFVLDGTGAIAFTLPSVPDRFRQKIDLHLRYLLGRIDKTEHDRLVAHPGAPGTAGESPRLKLARRLMREKDFRAAVKILEEERKAHPQDRSTALLLARAHLALGDVKAAGAILDPLASAQRQDVDLLLALADLQTARNRPERALEHLEAALKAAPSDPRVLYALGRHHERAGNLALAVENYRRALEIVLRAP